MDLRVDFHFGLCFHDSGILLRSTMLAAARAARRVLRILTTGPSAAISYHALPPRARARQDSTKARTDRYTE